VESTGHSKAFLRKVDVKYDFWLPDGWSPSTREVSGQKNVGRKVSGRGRWKIRLGSLGGFVSTKKSRSKHPTAREKYARTGAEGEGGGLALIFCPMSAAGVSKD